MKFIINKIEQQTYDVICPWCNKIVETYSWISNKRIKDVICKIYKCNYCEKYFEVKLKDE